MRGVFYNSRQAVCSIYSSGLMCYEVLKTSSLYKLDYTEEEWKIDHESDFLVFNHHPSVLNWVTEASIRDFKGITFSIVTEIGLIHTDDPAPVTPKIFDHYIIIDPTIKETEKMHAFPRPLLECPMFTHIPPSIPMVGSFGFATPGKEWVKIIDMVVKEFDEAFIRFNIPKATYVPYYIHDSILNEIRMTADVLLRSKPKIRFEMTHNVFHSQQEIVEWCSQNTINVFLYDRPHQTGLAAVVDQAILSGRPLLVSSHKTFRHIHSYLPHTPDIGIKEAISSTVDGVLKMRDDWSAKNFVAKFEKLLSV